MKKTLILLMFIYLLSVIICTENNTKIDEDKNKDKDKEKMKKENIKEETKEDNKEEEKENEAEEEEENSGFYISEKKFDEKLKEIIDEKKLKPKKKITKEQLRVIFNIIYKKEEKPEEEKNPDNDFLPEDHDKQYMDSIFNEVTKSLDYDDKIRVKEIKEWINPLKVQEAYAELLQGLTETMGYL
jgi:hypothetical protein